MRFLIVCIIVLFLGCCTADKGKPPGLEKLPNIILIISDDQGYGDMGFHGNPHINTPVLDRLAKESIRFTNFYVSPVCAPTRSSLMTGRYSLRTGVWDTYNGGAIMATEEKTIAEYLAEMGYKTGIFGKWHLGDNYPFRPQDQGFSETLIHPAGGMGQVGDIYNYFSFDSAYFNPTLLSNGKPQPFKGYCSDVFTDGAMEFIRANSQQPFFTYLSFNAPHTPLQLPEKYWEMYRTQEFDTADYALKGYPLRSIDEWAAKRVYGMVSNIDDNLGRLLSMLEELNIKDQTMIIFMTDNGPQQRRYNAGMRGRKGQVYEGGIRVPFFVRYPEFGNSHEVNASAAHIDVLPTLLDLIGHPLPENIDGRSLRPLMEREIINGSERALYFYWQRGFPEPYRNVAVRKGEYKLIGHTGYHEGTPEFELFNIQRDPFEMFNLKDSEGSKFEELKNEFDRWYGQAINSPHLKPLPIHLGTENENPAILNRNDAKGQPGIWAQNDVFGFWDVETEKGVYDVLFHFKDTIAEPGTMVFRVGQRQKTLYHNDTTSRIIEFRNVNLPAVRGRFESWYLMRGGEMIMPFYVEVERK